MTAALVALGMILQQSSVFALGVVVGRSLGSDEFGLYSLLRNITTWLLTLTPIGLDLAIVKFASKPENASTAAADTLRLRMIVFAINLAIVVLGSLFIPSMLSTPIKEFGTIDAAVILSLASLPFMADLALTGAYLRASGRVRRQSLITDHLQSVIRLAAMVLAVLFNADLVTFIAINLIASAVSCVTSTLSINASRGPSAGAMPAAGRNVALVLGESVWMAMSLGAYGLLRVADIFVLSYFVPSDVLGNYAALATVATVVQVLPLAISHSLGPTVTRFHVAGDRNAIFNALKNNVQRSSIFASYVFAGICAFGPFLYLLFGETFVFDPALCVLVPLSWLIGATYNSTGLALSMTGRHRIETALILSGGAILVLLLAVLVPHWHTIGAAVAIVVALACIQGGRVVVTGRVLGRNIVDLSQFIAPVLGIVTAFLSKYLLEVAMEINIFSVAAFCALYSALYWATIYATRLAK